MYTLEHGFSSFPEAEGPGDLEMTFAIRFPGRTAIPITLPLCECYNPNTPLAGRYFVRLRGLEFFACRPPILILAAVMGGLAFWMPNLLLRLAWINMLHDSDVPNGTIISISLVGLPFLSVIVFRLFSKREKSNSHPGLIAASVVFGIWVMGPLFILADASILGGFTNARGLPTLLLRTALFPILTFIGSTYDGSLGALLAATICIFVAAFRLAEEVCKRSVSFSPIRRSVQKVGILFQRLRLQCLRDRDFRKASARS